MPFLSCGGVFGGLTIVADVQSYDTSQPVQKRPRTLANSPAPGCRSGPPPGNQRNLSIGRMKPALGSAATWDDTYGAYLTEPSFCGTPGTALGIELVGVNDNDDIEWDPSVSGRSLCITMLNER